MKPHEIILKLEQTPGRLDKIDILTSSIKENTQFYVGLLLAYDYKQVFNVDKIPTLDSTVSYDLSDLYETEGNQDNHTAFMSLARMLQTRSLTGNKAKDAISSFMNKCSSDEWNYWYRRILKKDLGCGINIASINKAIEKAGGLSLVPTFEIQLATPSDDHIHKMINKNVRVEYKYDGVRVLTFVSDTGIKQISRNGKEFNNFTPVVDYISTLNLGGEYVLDGEIISDSFAKLMTQTNRKKDVNTFDCKYVIFDIIPLSDFTAEKCSLTLRERLKILEEKIKPYENEYVSTVTGSEFILTNEKLLDPYMETALSLKYEGIMVKDMESTYEFKRTDSWLKIKPWIDMDLEIIGFEIGTGKNSARLGNLICKGLYNNEMIEVSVGSGFSEVQREEIWSARDQLIGQIVEIRADCVSENAKTKEKSLRFPRFIRFRGFESGEKI